MLRTFYLLFIYYHTPFLSQRNKDNDCLHDFRASFVVAAPRYSSGISRQPQVIVWSRVVLRSSMSYIARWSIVFDETTRLLSALLSRIFGDQRKVSLTLCYQHWALEALRMGLIYLQSPYDEHLISDS